jgi:hypothetical protein
MLEILVKEVFICRIREKSERQFEHRNTMKIWNIFRVDPPSPRQEE